MKHRLRGHAINQRLLFLYAVFMLVAVTALTFGGQPRSTGLILFGVACLLVCIYITKVVARCPACRKDARHIPLRPRGSARFEFRNINAFARQRCPHCDQALTAAD
jgi:hypothetical protein